MLRRAPELVHSLVAVAKLPTKLIAGARNFDAPAMGEARSVLSAQRCKLLSGVVLVSSVVFVHRVQVSIVYPFHGAL